MPRSAAALPLACDHIAGIRGHASSADADGGNELRRADLDARRGPRGRATDTEARAEESGPGRAFPQLRASGSTGRARAPGARSCCSRARPSSRNRGRACSRAVRTHERSPWKTQASCGWTTSQPRSTARSRASWRSTLPRSLRSRRPCEGPAAGAPGQIRTAGDGPWGPCGWSSAWRFGRPGETCRVPSTSMECPSCAAALRLAYSSPPSRPARHEAAARPRGGMS